MTEPKPFPAEQRRVGGGEERERGREPFFEHAERAPETPSGPASVTPLPEPPIVPPVKPLVPVGADQRPLVQNVERVLSDGLEETYRQLDPSTQEKFRRVGEQTAVTISGLLEQVQAQTKKIIDLIMSWLRIIPGVNRYFLEQEAKIKADRLLALRHRPPS